jgi:tRNA (uracil-5-)-methyltransferase TRM9
MNDATIKRLNQINREFYRTTADPFDQSRRDPWPGWEKLVPYLKTPLSVLDVGCGNGRFGVFLAQRLGPNLRYTGLDNNADLLERARESLSGLNAGLEIRDVIEQPPDSGAFDLVVAFGLLHHVPGSQQRRDFVRKLAQRTAPGGILAFTSWRFYDYSRFRERIVPWPPDLTVEPNDYLLDWRRGAHALRYCHYIDETEQGDLIAAAGLIHVQTYRADGNTGAMNCYSVLRRNVD